MDQTLTVVTANLARGRDATWRWLESTLEERKPAVIFGQELNGGERLDDLAQRHGYRVVWPAVLQSNWQCVSWVMAKSELDPQPSRDQALKDRLAPHESYVAAAQMDWPALGPLTVLSVHASPQIASAAVVDSYPGTLSPARRGSERAASGSRYYYSDLLLDALAQAASCGPVLAVGDLNEARAWDQRNPGQTWGAEFFDAVSDRGLRDVTWGLWEAETRTRFHTGHPDYQLDFFLASPDVAKRAVAAKVDAGWSERTVQEQGLSDHAPVWLTLSAGSDSPG